VLLPRALRNLHPDPDIGTAIATDRWPSGLGPRQRARISAFGDVFWNIGNWNRLS